jgi:CBS domain-containing protein
MNADVTVREMMNREYVGVSESDDLIETVELLLREDTETAIVQRGSEHIGVLTERDILATLVEGPDPEKATVGDSMTESVPTVAPDQSLDAAADEMSTRSSRRLVVTDGSEPLGIITERDLLASRTYEHGTIETESPERGAVVARAAGSDAELAVETGEGFEDQSICEGCGTLTGNLASFNGQLLCPDCRDI